MPTGHLDEDHKKDSRNGFFFLYDHVLAKGELICMVGFLKCLLQLVQTNPVVWH